MTSTAKPRWTFLAIISAARSWSAIVAALGTAPASFSGALASQGASLLAGELDERSWLPVIVIDESHLLSNDDLGALRKPPNVPMGTESHFALILVV